MSNVIEFGRAPSIEEVYQHFENGGAADAVWWRAFLLACQDAPGLTCDANTAMEVFKRVIPSDASWSLIYDQADWIVSVATLRDTGFAVKSPDPVIAFVRCTLRYLRSMV